MKDEKLIELFEKFCKTNDEEIKNKQDFMPICITINKDYSINIIVFTFKNQDEKIKMREMLKQLVVTQNIKGYVLIQDAKITKIHQETGEREVSDVSLRNLFTPKFAISRFQEYNDGVLGKITEINDRKDMRNDWDCWNEVEKMEGEDKENKEYNKYKAEHPELYKGVYDLNDYNKTMNDKGELIFAFKVENKQFKYYMAENMSKEDKKKLDVVMDMSKTANEMFGIEMIKVDEHGIVEK